MIEPEPWGEYERDPTGCTRCSRPVPVGEAVCAVCLDQLEREHRPAFERDVARLELHLRFEADYPCEGGA